MAGGRNSGSHDEGRQVSHPQERLAAALADRNRLEALKGKRAGQHSIRVNDQYRVCFRWTVAGAEEVEIVDYH